MYTEKCIFYSNLTSDPLVKTLAKDKSYHLTGGGAHKTQDGGPMVLTEYAHERKQL